MFVQNMSKILISNEHLDIRISFLNIRYRKFCEIAITCSE